MTGPPNPVTSHFKEAGLDFSTGAARPNSDAGIESVSKTPSLMINLATELNFSFQRERERE